MTSGDVLDFIRAEAAEGHDVGLTNEEAKLLLALIERRETNDGTVCHVDLADDTRPGNQDGGT
jgi:hypothetical protein